ncbi:metabolite traffic protein EboE [Membranicola marinus]|uniref:Metabolite traffic protein EboE n=1 Tax=Membranihabitans marinus TaxID=1227546 RepID=A0A953L630_9BACT|nr:metabolite traffic protein EboE [Membranihabitans marinus]MBY5957222.1 metabolite traffic protein EboE [Membranihabitans marinus]
MRTNSGHLSYCTNIHSGEDWSSHFQELSRHLPRIKKEVSPDEDMGIGLRINHQMARDLLEGNSLEVFQSWLEKNGFYVFTLNGFPYGSFHGEVIKDQVHAPDWTTTDRLAYTLRLFDILARLLPADVESGGISTSPLSYRYWHKSEKERNEALNKATDRIIEVAVYLDKLKDKFGKNLHLDLEPEPDGLIGNGEEFIQWYDSVLLTRANKVLKDSDVSSGNLGNFIRKHIQLCYDVCHMAVEFENQSDLINTLRHNNIPIGKIQLSSALRLKTGINPEELRKFDEPYYLHQVVIKKPDGALIRFRDLPAAFDTNENTDGEWRVHFHVPVFTKAYGVLSSTQDYLVEILDIHRKSPLTDHFEIETYTWDVLPDELQLPVSESIIREIETIQKWM